MVAGKLMYGKERIEIDRETLYAKSEYKGRNLLVMKAEGPLGTVGKPHTGGREAHRRPEQPCERSNYDRCRLEARRRKDWRYS